MLANKRATKTRLTCFALIDCTLFNWVSCVCELWNVQNSRRSLATFGDSWVASVRVSIATQLNSTINGP